MAQQEITGAGPNELQKLREQFQESNAAEWYDFEDRYCLLKIPYQPEDYDGPERHCKAAASDKHEDVWRCKAHKGKGIGNPDKLTEGNPKHYMHATDEFLMDHLTEAEEDLYHQILGWAEIYGIDQEEDPSAYDDLKLLAKQRVREVKASQYVFEEGEITDKFIRDDEGQVVLDENGDPKTEDDINPASEEYRRLVGLIRDLKRELGITRKEQLKAEDRSKHADQAEATSEAMSELVSDDEKDFDIDDYE